MLQKVIEILINHSMYCIIVCCLDPTLWYFCKTGTNLERHNKFCTVGNFCLSAMFAVKVHHSVKWHKMATPHRSAAGWGFGYIPVSDTGKNCTYDIALVTQINIRWWLCQSQRPLQRKGCQNGDGCSGAKPLHRLQPRSVHETRSKCY